MIARTVRRAPEVMVKVLTRGAHDSKSVGRHFAYLSRKGSLELETDDGTPLTGRDSEKALLKDWDLELDEVRRGGDLRSRSRRTVPRLVHKLIFSMPPGTPPDKVLQATRNFAREEFALNHRYALALHTDEPHPHVHVVVKAISEQGVRLNIRRAMLRSWRQGFADHLRRAGVQANATERAVRGQTRVQKLDGIFRASVRGESSHMRDRKTRVARELAAALSKPGPAVLLLTKTRQAVVEGWRSVARRLENQGEYDLSREVLQFLASVRAPLSEQQQIANQLSIEAKRGGPADRRR